MTDSGTRHFLSVYMEAPDVAGLTVMRHDHCAALWTVTRGRAVLQRYWEFERVTGLKHHRLPLFDLEVVRGFLDTLLVEEGLTLDAMEAVWGTPFIETDSAYRDLVGSGETVHSTSHLYSALGMDFSLIEDEVVLGLALDAGPDVQLESEPPVNIYSGCVARDGAVTTFPVESPAALWLRARGKFGREEGTLMALSTATTCTVSTEAEQWAADLPFFTQRDVFASADSILERVIEGVWSVLSTDEGRAQSNFDERFSFEDNAQSAVMKEVEGACWVVVDRVINRIVVEFGLEPRQTHLAIAGGFALNCPNNSRLIKKFEFRSLLAPPCANDGGQALGLGVLGLHSRGLAATLPAIGHAFFGRTPRGLSEALRRFEDHIESVEPLDLSVAIDDIVAEPVAWVQGRSEMGPRALGHRSLLGDPRTLDTRDRLNELKLRQWWRPVAPIVLEEYSEDWFVDGRRSPFMLEVLAGRDDKRHLMPAVLHLDGTARLQTVARHDEPELHALISAFHERFGVPILGNTSLNDKGEPLVDTAAEALNFCVRKGVNTAYVDGHRIRLRQGVTPVVTGPEPRADQAFREAAATWSKRWADWSDQSGLPSISLFVLAWNPRLRDTVDVSTAAGRRVLQVATHNAIDLAGERERRFLEVLDEAFGPTADPWASSLHADFVGGGYH